MSSIRGTSTPVRWLIQLLSLTMIVGLSLSSSVVAAQAASPAAKQVPTSTTPSTQAPASGTPATPATAGFTLRVEPRATGGVDRAAARARLAQLLGAQVGPATRAAGVPTTTSTPTAGTVGTRPGVRLTNGKAAPRRPLTKAQKRQLLERQKLAEARRRAQLAQAEATARLQEALQALARALSTSQCHTVGGTNGQQASISCPLDTGSSTGTGTGDRHHRDGHRHDRYGNRHRHRNHPPGDDRDVRARAALRRPGTR